MTLQEKTRERLNCRLTRRDGSEWQVTKLDLEGPPTVTARLAGAITPRRASRGDPTRLDDEPLERGDRLLWFDAEGKVVWAMKAPLGTEG